MTNGTLDERGELNQRQRLVRKLKSDLRRFQRIPVVRRELECADEGEQTCLALLQELGAEV